MPTSAHELEGMEQEPLKKQYEQATQASFDVLASVRLIRNDLSTTGVVHPETMQRVYDEELTLVAEGVDRHAYTSFTLQREGDDLVIFHEGKMRPYTASLLRGLNAAKEEALIDGRKQFKLVAAEADLVNGYKMHSLKPGETMTWDSPYPRAEAALYGEEFMRNEGLQPHREMGFLYRAHCNEDGSVTLETHTVDNSDEDAFAAVRNLEEFDPGADMETRIRTYDGVLKMKTGQDYRAGRLNADREEDAYTFIRQQKGLVDYYMGQIVGLAESDQPEPVLEQSKKDLTYSFWSRIKELLDKGHSQDTTVETQTPIVVSNAQYAQEMHLAYLRSATRGEVMSGCGGAIGGKSLNELDSSEAFDAIFGEKVEKEKTSYAFDKEMYCVSCQAPPAEEEGEKASKKMCGPCGLCRDCDAKFSTK